VKNKNLFSIFLLSLSAFWVGWLSYLYQFIMLKALDTASFWDFASLVWVINLLAVITTGFWLFLVKEFAQSKWANQNATIIYISIKYWLIVSSLLYAIYIGFSWILGNYLNISSTALILITGLGILLSFTALYQNAYYQANKYFSTLSLLQFLNPLLRITLGAWMVWMWYGVIGWVLGFILPFYILFFVRFFHIRYIEVSQNSWSEAYSKTTEKRVVKDFLSQKKQILQYLATSILVALLMNIDILIVKNIFDGETAGYYAAVSVLAKFLVFLGLSIETVYYPQLVKESVLPKIALLKVSVYYAAMTLWAVVFFILFGEMILRLFKDWLEDYISLIYPLLIYCGLLGYLSIIVKTLIAFEQYTINYLLWALIVGLVVCLYSLGTSLLAVTQIFAVFWLLGLGLGLSQLIRR